MVETTDRYRVRERPRSSTATEYEVFVRDERDGRMRHVGSVTAASPGDAHERATKLFAWFAASVWVCPAESMTRFSADPIDDEATASEFESAVGRSDERRQREL